MNHPCQDCDGTSCTRTDCAYPECTETPYRYEEKTASAKAWLGNRYLLAKPINKVSAFLRKQAG